MKYPKKFPNTKRGIIVEEIKEIKEELAKINKITAELNLAKQKQKLKSKNIIIGVLIFLLAFSVFINIYLILSYSQVEESVETTTTTIEDVEQSTENGGNNTLAGGDYNGKTEN